MAGFSVSEAFGAGFRVIRRKPLAMLMWGVAYFVVGVLPTLLVLGLGIQGFIAMMAEIDGNASADASAYSTAMMSGPLALLQPVSFLTSIAAGAIVMNAVFRAVLEPEDDAFFYLRIGGVELWQGLVQLCFRILIGIAGFGVILAAAIVAGIGAVVIMAGGARSFEPWMVLPLMLLGLIVLGVIVWLTLRLSMGGPLTFMDRTFRLFESWTLTKGHAGSLFLLALLLFLVVIVIEMLVGAIMFGVFIAMAGGVLASVGEAGLKGFFAQPPAHWVPVIIPAVLVMAAIGCALGGFIFAIILAPWADACRQLRGDTAATPTAPAAPLEPLDPAGPTVTA